VVFEYDASTGERIIDEDETTSERLERDLSGLSFTLGAVGQIGDRLDLGLSFETPVQLDGDFRFTDGTVDSSSKKAVEFPLRLQVGGVYHPRNTYQTTFALDVVFMPWSKASDDLIPDQNLNDIWQVRFGLEHIFYNKLPGRIGFRYAESYALEEAEVATFTFGFGYIMNSLLIDLGGEVGKRNSRQEPLRERSAVDAPYAGEGRDWVQDTVVRLTLGVDYAF